MVLELDLRMMQMYQIEDGGRKKIPDAPFGHPGLVSGLPRSSRAKREESPRHRG